MLRTIARGTTLVPADAGTQCLNAANVVGLSPTLLPGDFRHGSLPVRTNHRLA